MGKITSIADKLRARGVVAPAFFALGTATEAINLQKDSQALLWMGLCYLVMGLVFSRYTGQLLVSAVGD